MPVILRLFLRFDSEGQKLDAVSISDLKSGGLAGGNTNWKTLYEVKSENLGQGDKVAYIPNVLHRHVKCAKGCIFKLDFWYKLSDINSKL